MKTIVDPRERFLFNLDGGAFSPLARRRLVESWPGVFRGVVLEKLPADELAAHFSADQGRPTRELYSIAGLILIMEFKDWTAEEAADAYMFHRDVQFALNLGPDRQSLSARAVERFKKIFRTDELARQVMDRVVGTLIEELEIKVERQRLDSTHLLSNMAVFTRTRLMGVCIRRFLARLRTAHRRDYAALDEALRARYAATENALFADVSRARSARRQLREEVAAQMYGLITRFETHARISALKSFAALRTVFAQQCELKEQKVIVRAKTGARVIQNPSDPDATYDGHKGPGYQVQICETCHPDNEVQLITATLPQTACETDGQALGQVLEQLQANGALPAELVADTHYGSDQNHADCHALGIELISPVCGPDPKVNAGSPAAISNAGKTAPPEVPRTGKAGAAEARRARLAARRAQQQTPEWRRRYRIRAGIEATHSGLKRHRGLARLRVRGESSVTHATLLKIAGQNILRAAGCTKLRAKIARQVRQGRQRVVETAGQLLRTVAQAMNRILVSWQPTAILCAVRRPPPRWRAA